MDEMTAATDSQTPATELPTAYSLQQFIHTAYSLQPTAFHTAYSLQLFMQPTAYSLQPSNSLPAACCILRLVQKMEDGMK